MQTANYFAAIIVLTLSPAALANSIQFTVNSSVVVTGDSPNDSYWGYYTTPPDAFGTTPTVNAEFPFGFYGNPTTFSNVSFSVPAGSVITSATMNLVFPTGAINGTGSVGLTSETLPQPDPNGRHIPPTFGPGTSVFYINDVFLQGNGTSSEDNFPLNTPFINGDEVSTGTWDLVFTLQGDVSAPVTVQGYNWDGYIGGQGQATIPYSVQIDVNYTPVPEPPGFVLLATAMIGLVGVARRKLLAN
jgi:hypothetical protein